MRRRFRRELAWGLMKNWLKITSGASAMKRVNDEGGDIEGYRRRQNSSILAASDERLSMNVKHLPKVTGGRKRNICTICSYRLLRTEGRASAANKTAVYCLGCLDGTYLCISEDRNCLEAYHMVKDLASYAMGTSTMSGWGSMDRHRDVCSHQGPQRSLLNGVWGEKAILRVSWLTWPQIAFYGRIDACNGHYTDLARELINFCECLCGRMCPHFSTV